MPGKLYYYKLFFFLLTLTLQAKKLKNLSLANFIIINSNFHTYAPDYQTRLFTPGKLYRFKLFFFSLALKFLANKLESLSLETLIPINSFSFKLMLLITMLECLHLANFITINSFSLLWQ
jgi:hypothetical protein